MMSCGDLVDMFGILNFLHKVIPRDLDHLIGNVIYKNSHEVLHLMSEEKKRKDGDFSLFAIANLY